MLKSNADDEKLPRLLDANLKHVRTKQMFAWWKEWTAKMKSVQDWKESREHAKDKVIKKTYFKKILDLVERTRNHTMSKSKIEREIKRKFLTVWVNQLNSRRKK